MDEREKVIRLKLKNDFEHYASKCLKIRSKSGDIEPFELNKAQLYIHNLAEQQRNNTGKIRCIILKGRQQGCSTLIEGRFYWRVSHSFGTQAFILTHALDATNNLYKMAQRYHEHCPSLVKPEVNTKNSKELIFGRLDSGYKIGTAENKSVGRSSTIQLFHGSEVAFWQNASEHAKGIMQAVPSEPNTEIFLESTANGIGNYFHQQWQLAEASLSEFIPIFIPWFWQEEYTRSISQEFVLSEEEYTLKELYGLTNEQLLWRRIKITELSIGGMDGTKAFMQEYPCCAAEAFQTTGEDTFISANIAIAASKQQAEPHGALLIGVDPARFGDDRTCIVRRQSRVVSKIDSYVKKDTMEIANIVHLIIEAEKPDRVCVDVVGLGAGVYDRLKELGHKDILVSVNGGSSPRDPNKFLNKRAEMWSDMREWLLDYPIQIPDSKSLLSDLCGLRYKFDNKGRLVLEKKEEMKKRGIRSPDEADALSLTFCYPESALIAMINKRSNETASRIAAQYKKVQRIKDNRTWK